MNTSRKAEIEQSARLLQREIWRNRGALLPGNTPTYFQALLPYVAAAHLGLEYKEEPTLGVFGNSKERFEVAGFIDRRRKSIAVSMGFDIEVRRFTAAHELGHWMLHPSMDVLHRDRPLKGGEQPSVRHDPIEQEANYFAACFLMPQRLVEQEFRKVFGSDISAFKFDFHVASALSPRNPDLIYRPVAGSRSRGLALAALEPMISGLRRVSFAKRFGVSPLAMAIRLEELGLSES